MSYLRRLLVCLAATLTLLGVGPAAAEKIANKVAVFSGLDKITGRIITFDAHIGETVQFGMLQVAPKVCYSRPETEAAATDAFVEVDEVTLDNHIKRIFNGWMFAASPGLNAVEHPVYDVWLSDCRMDSDVAASADGSPRLAVARSGGAAGGGSGEGGEVTLTMVGGVPLPPVKPSAPPAMTIDSGEPEAPTDAPASEGGDQILD
jgi:hypothetical protein